MREVPRRASGIMSIESKTRDARRFLKLGTGISRKARGRFADGGVQYSSPRTTQLQKAANRTGQQLVAFMKFILILKYSMSKRVFEEGTRFAECSWK